jgi:hypothetical protein
MQIHLPADANPSGPLLLYDNEDRTGTPTGVAMTSHGAGSWTADPTGLTGRWWPTVTYTIDGDPAALNLPPVDLPETDTLIVSPEDLAEDADMTLPLTDSQRRIITRSILAAQSKVVAHLGRAIVPTVYTEHGRWDVFGQWNLTPLDEPVRDVLTVTAETISGQPTGRYTVTYLAGLDAKNDPDLAPIREFVTADAMNSPGFTRMWRTATKPERDIRSAATQGQSISYAPATLGGGGKGQPGELPTLASLNRWRLIGVHQRPVEEPPPWPYNSVRRVGW